MFSCAKYEALEVSEYILYYYSQTIKDPISNLKLQKILYYVQAKFLVEKKEPCFKEDILAWQYGPVVLEVYNEYRYNSARSIMVEESNVNIDYKDKNLIESICKSKTGYTAFQLVDHTHEEDPWQSIYDKKSDDIITEISIYNYFLQNEVRLGIIK
jgi:uncharacterized phage-associated protein